MISRIVARADGLKTGKRGRQILSGIAGLLFSRGVSFAALLVTVPLILRHLGTERFGVWMTLTSLAAVLSVSDFGIGNGIKTEVARAHGRNDVALLRKVVLNGAVTLTALGVTFIVATLIAHPFINWAYFFNVQDPVARQEAATASLIFMLSSFISVPLSLGSRIRAGMQREYLNGIWTSVGTVASLLALLVGVWAGFGLPALLLGFVGSPALVTAVATVATFARDRDILMPRRADLDMREVRRLFLQGLRYLAVTLVYVLTFTIDNFVIARTLGPQAVAQYSVADRLFQIISVALTMVNTPFWPAYAAAHASGDSAWVLRTFRRAFRANLLFACAGAAVLLAFAGPIYHLWIGSVIVPALPLLLAIASRRIMEALYSACNVLMNSLDELSIQIGWGLAMGLAAVATRLLLLPYMGLSGVPSGVSLAVLGFGFVPTVIAVRRLSRAGPAQA